MKPESHPTTMAAQPVGRTALLLTLGLAVAFALSFWWLGGLLPAETWILRADYAGILLGYVLACFAAGGGLTGLIYRAQIRAWWWRTRGRRDSRSGAPLDMAEKVEAIVLPVSRSAQPSWIIEHLRPDYVALLYSEVSREEAFQIEKTYRHRTRFEPTVAEMESHGRRLTDAHDLRETKLLAESLIRHLQDGLRVPRHRIFVDTTGGTKPMSLGAFQAAEEAQVSSIYVQGQVAGPSGPIIADPTKREDGDPRFMSDWTTVDGAP